MNTANAMANKFNDSHAPAPSAEGQNVCCLATSSLDRALLPTRRGAVFHPRLACHTYLLCVTKHLRPWELVSHCEGEYDLDFWT